MTTAIDLETFLIAPGVLAPRGVCASIANAAGVELVQFPYALEPLRELLESGEVLVGANIAYDFAVILRESPSLLSSVITKYERGEVWDVLIAATLHAIAEGRFLENGIQSHSGLMLRVKGDEGALAKRFSLETSVWYYLGRKDAKANADFRLRYGELAALPMSEWPPEAIQYPKDDALNTLQVYEAQQQVPALMEACGKLTRHDWTQMTHHARAAFGLHLASVWGLRADRPSVEALSDFVEKEYAKSVERFLKLGFLKDSKLGPKKDLGVIRERVLRTYSENSKPCKTCKGARFVNSPKSKVKLHTVTCRACSGTGREVDAEVPQTSKGAISTDRQTLRDSGDPDLIAWAEAGLLDKLRETYLPMLREGTRAPINTRANVLVDSGRTSYSGLVQLIPSKGGVRECFIPSAGRVFCSVDYAALELCTLAQVCLDLFQESAMADIINRTKDPGALHTEFAAKMAGVTDLEAFAKEAKVKGSKAAALRQMAKAANFGFPGLMGPATFVAAKRREGLFLCVAAGIADKCTEKVTEWMGRKLNSPTCAKCISVASDLRAAWLKQWPEIKKYFDWVSNTAGTQNGTARIVSPMSGYIRGGMYASALANHSFQHLAAMGAKHALWRLTKDAFDASTPFFSSRPVLFVHDEVIAEIPEGRFSEAAPYMAKVMVDAMREFVPDVYISAEPAGMYRWDKRAEPVYKNGVLIPWTPPVT